MVRKLNEQEEKKLQSINKRILKCAKDIADMGFNVYLNSAGLSIIDSDSHDKDSQPLYDNVIMTIRVQGWDGGDW